jgi:hypothetical protein
MNAKWVSILGAAAALWPAWSGAECRAASPDQTVALIELYTSEGCDSCPPADRWLSALDLGAPATRAVAIAFHVDYWDRLGWRDRFGNAIFTERQYDQMRRRHAAFVHTPQVLLQGTEFSRWRDASQPVAALAIDLYVRVPQIRDRVHAAIAVALTQSRLASDVKAGENAGKRLVHDHVVRAWHAGAPIGVGGELRQHFTFPLPTDRGPLEIVAFAENTATGEVLQALAMPVCTR